MARSNAIGKLREIIESEIDVRTALLQQVGDISGLVVMHCQVLVATHPGAKYHPGTKILRTDKDLLESQYQGTVGLVLKCGPGAFVDAPGATFHRQSVKEGDWVLTRPSDGLQLYIRQVPCRLFDDINIKMIVTNPEIYW